MAMRELEIRVRGRVQGIRFRQMVCRKATVLGITGHVMNRADGSVDILAQGWDKELRALLHWIETSPGFSSIQGMQFQWGTPSRAMSEFSMVKDASFVADQARSFFNLGRTLFSRQARAVPTHIAIIPDGNRRWARTRRQQPEFGHYTSASFQHLHGLFSAAREQGVRYLTLWGFSTENWKRTTAEQKALFALIEQGVQRLRADVSTQKIRFRHIGRKDRLPASLLSALAALELESKEHGDFQVQLCLDYGGSDELVRAVNKLLVTGKTSIDEASLRAALDAPDVPPIDLVIRTSGEQRISGFMPLQASYAELYFTPVHFPDFDAREFLKALQTYAERQRRFGG